MKYKIGDKIIFKRDRDYDNNVREFLESVDYIQTMGQRKSR